MRPKRPIRKQKYGADERTRTVDLLITSELLYQLSYVGLKLLRGGRREREFTGSVGGVPLGVVAGAGGRGCERSGPRSAPLVGNRGAALCARGHPGCSEATRW